MATRIRLRYDTLDNWQNTSAGTILPGEFAVAQLSGGGVTVKVGNGDGNTAVSWEDAAEISGSGIPDFDVAITNASVGDVLYYNGSTWVNSSLLERFDVNESAAGDISISSDSNGKIIIKYQTLTFSPSFSLTEPNDIIEVREKYTNSITGTGSLGPNLNFSLSNGGNVNFTNAEFNTDANNNNYDITYNLDFSNSAGSKEISITNFDSNGEFEAEMGTSTSTGFRLGNADSRRETFSVVFTPDTSSGYNGGTITRTDHLYYGWRGFFVYSNTLYSSATELQNDINNTTIFTNSYKLITPTGTSFPSTVFQLIQDDFQEAYVYFLHSCNIVDGTDTFGWNPQFRDPQSNQEIFTDITGSNAISYNKSSNFQYRVHIWGSPAAPNQIGSGQASEATLTIF